jgi:hypothetical protein
MATSRYFEFGEESTFGVRVVLEMEATTPRMYFGSLKVAVAGRWWGDQRHSAILNNGLSVLQRLPLCLPSIALSESVEKALPVALIATGLQTMYPWSFPETLDCEQELASDLKESLLAPLPIGELFDEVAIITIRTRDVWRMCAAEVREDPATEVRSLHDVRECFVSHQFVSDCIARLFAALPPLPDWRQPEL